ncbi:hypothetical protein [Aureispira anguillae]|uniref:Lipoprotein n=1 Tax=Aureispira anguillae TaxID=2864201 RepID=A0A915YIZ2_9BACT|nr:hypothetical protein [Aureispira anguillae]BDS13713.1 hypothetical protein AsAng_0044540 [Aureispira anguillae]
MNKTFARLFVAIIAIAGLVTSQFWSCSTAQSITFVSPQIQSDAAPSGETVLLFKLLTPMMPDDGQQITKNNPTDAKDSDKNLPWIALSQHRTEATFETLNFTQNVSPYSFKENKAYTQCYALSTPSRGPPHC